MNKNFYCVLLLFVMAHNAVGQQIPQYSQYIWNNYLINPAIAGAENYFEVKGGYRNQWIGMEGAPKTMFFTAQGQVGKKLENKEYIDVIDRSLERKPRRGLKKALNIGPRNFPKPPKNYERKGHHGVGGQIMNDRIGPFNTSAFYLTYAYHLPLSEHLTAALGVSLGAKQYRIDPLGLDFGDKQFDNTMAPGPNSYGLSPDGSIGGLIYSEKFYIGISTDQIMSNKISIANGSDVLKGKLVPHFFLNGGYRIKLSNEMAVVPSAMLRIYPNTPISADITSKFNYMDVLWFGASYRANDALIGLLGISIKKQIDIGYSYDFNTSKLNRFNGGTHEIVLGFRLINRKTNDCRPSYTW